MSTNCPIVLANLSAAFSIHLLLVTNIGFVPREEGVEGEARDENAVHELDDAGEDEEEEERVDEFQAGGCGVEVRVPERMQGD